jgi:hypothetical protein
VAQHDSKSIARQWNREIEEEIRHHAEAQAERGPWRSLVWTVLWMVWLSLLVLVFAHFLAFR